MRKMAVFQVYNMVFHMHQEWVIQDGIQHNLHLQALFHYVWSKKHLILFHIVKVSLHCLQYTATFN
jgi:hypothetical protein